MAKMAAWQWWFHTEVQARLQGQEQEEVMNIKQTNLGARFAWRAYVLSPGFLGFRSDKPTRVPEGRGNLCHVVAGTDDPASKQMSDIRGIVDTLVAIAVMEAVVKPVVTRLTKTALGWADQYLYFIPNWLYHAPSPVNCQENPCQEQKAQDQ